MEKETVKTLKWARTCFHRLHGSLMAGKLIGGINMSMAVNDCMEAMKSAMQDIDTALKDAPKAKRKTKKK